MKKLLLILALAIGLVFTGQACTTISKSVITEAEQYRTIVLEREDNKLETVIPANWPNFFVHPYEFELSISLTPTYSVMALRHKNIFEDVYVVGVVFEEGHFTMVNMLRGIDDTYWVYPNIWIGEKGMAPHKVTKEEFFKNVKHWEDKTKEVY